MNIDWLKWAFSRKARRIIKENIKLIMTLVVKNEEDIIEQNIRFHCAMGVDGVIVISHNSTDNTNAILEKLKSEGFVLEIIKKTTPNHQHSIWVNEMVKIAKNKYGADWVINADADEFYYSNSLNLKKSILQCDGANSLRKVKKKNIGYIRVKSIFKKILANVLAGLIPVKSLRKQIRRKVSNDN